MNKQTFQYKLYKGRSYIRIIMQNSSNNIIFDNISEAKHYTKKEYSEYKFSILDEIDSITRYDSEYFEFLLCYPEYPICNRWKQIISPNQYTEKNNDVDSEAIGFKEIDNYFEQFKGLMVSTSSRSYLDGDGNELNNWAYAIGVCFNYNNNYYLPGPKINGGWKNFHEYELYLRVPSLYINKHHLNLFISSFILSYIFILNK